jgi:metallophosphoesterase superfamily enzyme
MAVRIEDQMIKKRIVIEGHEPRILVINGDVAVEAGRPGAAAV